MADGDGKDLILEVRFFAIIRENWSLGAQQQAAQEQRKDALDWLSRGMYQAKARGDTRLASQFARRASQVRMHRI